MYILFAGASLKIARNLIHTSGIRGRWADFLEKSQGTIDKRKLLREILGLNACNLSQSMKETLVDREIDAEDRQDLLDDYIVENLRLQDWITFQDGAELMGTCQEIEAVWERLRPHFSRTREAQGFKPVLEAVNDVMRHLGTDGNQPLKAALLDFVESQHRLFTGYFRGLLEPFSILEENSKAGPNQLLEPEDSEEPPLPVELEGREEPLFRAELVAPMEMKAPTEIPREDPAPILKEKENEKRTDEPNQLLIPPVAVELPTLMEPKVSIEQQGWAEPEAPVELKALNQPQALEEPQVQIEIPAVEPLPSLEERGDGKEPTELSTTPERLPEGHVMGLSDPTARLSQPLGAEESLFHEGSQPEEAAPLPESFLLPETVPPAGPTEIREPLSEPEPLRVPIPEKEAAPPMEKMFQIERPFPKAPPGSVRDINPKKLAEVFDILLALDPTADIKPIPPSAFPKPHPPKEPFSPTESEGTQEPPHPFR